MKYLPIVHGNNREGNVNDGGQNIALGRSDVKHLECVIGQRNNHSATVRKYNHIGHPWQLTDIELH